MEVSDHLHTSAALLSGKEPLVPLNGWAPELVWMFSRREKCLPLPGIEPPFLCYPVIWAV
jgi:hypothetical protein